MRTEIQAVAARLTQFDVKHFSDLSRLDRFFRPPERRPVAALEIDKQSGTVFFRFAFHVGNGLERKRQRLFDHNEFHSRMDCREDVFFPCGGIGADRHAVRFFFPEKFQHIKIGMTRILCRKVIQIFPDQGTRTDQFKLCRNCV